MALLEADVVVEELPQRAGGGDAILGAAVARRPGTAARTAACSSLTRSAAACQLPVVGGERAEDQALLDLEVAGPALVPVGLPAREGRLDALGGRTAQAQRHLERDVVVAREGGERGRALHP